MRSDSRRFIFLLFFGLLVFAAVFVMVLDQTSSAVPDSPILDAGAAPEPTTTTSPPTTVAPATTGAPAPAPARTGSAPVRPPSNPYAGEPIVEIGTIEIPKIGLAHRIMHGISLRNIDQGPSHWPGTAMPGEIGNSVFAGHRTTHSKPFRNIDQLVPGDEVFFTVNGVRSRYVVTGSEVVTPNRLDIVNQTPTPTATIFACHPPGSAKYRYVVRMALANEAPPAATEPAASGG